MKKKWAALCAVLALLDGCSKLSYEQLQAARKYCADRGMHTRVFTTGFNANLQPSSARCLDDKGLQYDIPEEVTK